MEVDMRRFKSIVISLIALFSLGVFAESTLEIKIKTAKNEYILGEPCIIDVVIKNNSEKAIPIYFGNICNRGEPAIFQLKINGLVRKECHFLPTIHYDRFGCGKKIEPKDKIENQLEIGILGVCSLGNYEIWLEYDHLAIPEYIVKSCGLSEIKASSNHLKVSFIQPTGVD